MWPLPDNDYVKKLMVSRGEDESLLDDEADRAIRALRLRVALEPWIALMRLPRTLIINFLNWLEKTYGRYRSSRSQVHGGADEAPSGSAGGTSPNYAALAAATRAAFRAAASSGVVLQSGGFTTTTVAAAVGAIHLYPIVHAPEIEDAGIKAGEIVGYRCWRLVDGLLYSCYERDVIWEPGKVIEGRPETGVEGVHAFKDRISMGSYGHEYRGMAENIVSGTVHLWGDVVEHERGYRASKAAIASIDDSPFYDAKALRRKYGLTRKRKKK